MSDPRLILYHQHPVSARTRFLRLGHGGICAPGPLPPGSRIIESGATPQVVVHPGALLRALERELALAQGALAITLRFPVQLAVDETTAPVFLARFVDHDPPIAEVGAQGARFIALTQASALPPVELDLLRHAYEALLG
ncbi:hypothetical protein [Marichromatium gracile]|uniref:Uncharacterized protein n=1 Tax=Marichromatium gracile TaxID=1048 RepID=A0ABR5VDH1_MARGR|nr:hypothetical protein [Marichromatium gracile]KXX63547.1 hypothetical protein AY586_16400 [Marichromatium gracile]